MNKTIDPARRRPESPNGFTILELLIVVMLILVLAGLSIAISGYVQKKGARSLAESEMAAISTALENYKADNGVYPSNSETKTLNPATTSSNNYQAASSYLYSQLSGDDDANPLTPSPIGAKNYLGSSLRPRMLAPNPPGPNTFLQDPFRNSYGYSTARAEEPDSSIGHNPTFDLWSTGNSADPSKWIKNW